MSKGDEHFEDDRYDPIEIYEIDKIKEKMNTLNYIGCKHKLFPALLLIIKKQVL